MNLHTSGLGAAAAEANAAAASRAAETRKKLMQTAQQIVSASSPEESAMLSRWAGPGPGGPGGLDRMESGSQPAAGIGRVPEFD